jgi:hypothetical protein
MAEEKDSQAPLLEDFDNLEVAYANNSRFETSVWDLKILFGQLDQHAGTSGIDWHTAVTMPWMQAKVFAYYLLLNIAIHEAAESGFIKVHPNVHPPIPPPLTEAEKKDPGAVALNGRIVGIYKELFGD